MSIACLTASSVVQDVVQGTDEIVCGGFKNIYALDIAELTIRGLLATLLDGDSN